MSKYFLVDVIVGFFSFALCFSWHFKPIEKLIKYEMIK